MQRRTRNRICIWIIVVGLVNFLAYTIVYAELGGDARNGGIEIKRNGDGTPVVDEDRDVVRVYYIKGHFIRGPAGERSDVHRWTWIYSYLHSISIWPTQGALMICMLILAQPHIIATMRENSVMQGTTFVSVAITLVAVVYTAMSVWFVLGFIGELKG
ncbi:MAG: hypothetical protein HY718_16845 [Planctomycetes bacterium]|nr:hypothetical protein [Planctomycetota bacterium]